MTMPRAGPSWNEKVLGASRYRVVVPSLPPLPNPWAKCESGCTHDLGRGVPTGKGEEEGLLSGDGPFVQGFAWNDPAEAVLRSTGDWNEELQAGIKHSPKQRARRNA